MKKIIIYTTFVFYCSNLVYGQVLFHFENQHIVKNGEIFILNVVVENAENKDIKLENCCEMCLYNDSLFSMHTEKIYLTILTLQDSVPDILFVSPPMFSSPPRFYEERKTYIIPAKSKQKITFKCDLRYIQPPKGRHKLVLYYKGEKQTESFIQIE